MAEAAHLSRENVEAWLDRLYIAAPGATLRKEDLRKATEVAALLVEIDRVVKAMRRSSHLTVVDAASGKSYLGLLTAKLVLEPMQRSADVLCIERNPDLVAHTQRAMTQLSCSVPIVCRCAALSDAAAWPHSPSLVLGLHACGSASDDIIARATVLEARTLLLIPCCVGSGVARVREAEQMAARMGLPRAAVIRRRFVHTLIEADRVLTLEAAGYQTEVVEFVAPTTTPYNTLLRARRVGEPTRMARAKLDLQRLWSLDGTAAKDVQAVHAWKSPTDKAKS